MRIEQKEEDGKFHRHTGVLWDIFFPPLLNKTYTYRVSVIGSGHQLYEVSTSEGAPLISPIPSLTRTDLEEDEINYKTCRACGNPYQKSVLENSNLEKRHFQLQALAATGELAFFAS